MCVHGEGVSGLMPRGWAVCWHCCLTAQSMVLEQGTAAEHPQECPASPLEGTPLCLEPLHHGDRDGTIGSRALRAALHDGAGTKHSMPTPSLTPFQSGSQNMKVTSSSHVSLRTPEHRQSEGTAGSASPARNVVKASHCPLSPAAWEYHSKASCNPSTKAITKRYNLSTL